MVVVSAFVLVFSLIFSSKREKISEVVIVIAAFVSVWLCWKTGSTTILVVFLDNKNT